MMRFFFLLFAACFCLLLAAAPVAAAVPDLDSGKERAGLLVEKKDYAAAYALYMDLLREYPDDPDVNLGLARAASLAGRNNHALMAYERLIAAVPEHAGLRMEFAQLLVRMGDSEGAKREMNEARKLDPSIKESDALALVKSLERQMATFTGSARIAGGALYDSNMNTGPSLRGVEIGGLPITLDSESSKKASWGSYLHAMGEGAWRANPESSWWLVGDLTGYQRWYEETSPRRDLTFGRAAAGVRYLRDSLMLEVRGKIDVLLENEEKSVNLYGGESTLVYALKPDTHLLARFGLEHREDIATRGRSGTYAWGGPYLRWFYGAANHSIMAGVKGYASSTNERRYGFSGVEPGLTFFFSLPWRTELIFSGTWHNEDYKGPATTLDGSGRRDRQWRAAAALIKKITDNFQLEAAWQYTDNRSNSDLYTYNQNMVMLGVAVTF